MASAKPPPDFKLRVFWDGYGLENSHSGVFRYAADLGQALHKLGCTPTVLLSTSQILIPGTECLPVPLGPLPKITKLKPFWSSRVAASIRRMQGREPKTRVIVHGLSNFNLPVFAPIRDARYVLNIHDLIPFFAPDDVSRALVWQLQWLMPKAVALADQILCLSEWGKRTVQKYFEINDDRKVVVVSPGYSKHNLAKLRIYAKSSNETVELLYVARWERYKRLEFLVDILRGLEMRFRLTIVTDSHGVEHLGQATPDLVRAGRLTLLTGQNESQLANLFEAADVYVHPSLFEGFGLPAEAALSRGKRIVYQAGSALDEVVGAMGTALSERASAQDWRDAIRRAAQNGADATYLQKLTDYYATKPTWDAAASKVFSIYDRLLTE